MLLGLFISAFLILVLIAFHGYRYIALTSEYASRNLVHLDAVNEAQFVVDQSRLDGTFPAGRVTRLVERAQNQAQWCLDVLGPVERNLISFLGESNAIDICLNDIHHADMALELLRDLGQLPDFGADSQRARLMEEVDMHLGHMVKDSRNFAPYVVRIREKITNLVRWGTFAAGLAMLGLMLTLSRTFVRNWREVDVKAQEILRQSTRFKLAMQSNMDGLALFDGDHKLMDCNSRFADFLRLEAPPDHMATLNSVFQDVIDAGTLDAFEGTADDLLSDLDRVTAEQDDGGLQVALSGDHHLWISWTDTDLGDRLLLIKDITQRVRSDREKEEQARQMQRSNEQFAADAKRDPLTGLANRRGLEEEMQARGGSGPVTLIRIDLDRFKEVNDIFGHDAGDHVLKHVADLMLAFGRGKDFPVRVGGDEFVILCEPGTNADKAVGFANRLLERLSEPLMYQDKQLMFGASFGIASSEDGSDDLETLLQSADAALYLAKESGRGTVKLFTPALKLSLSRDKHLADTLRPALMDGDFKAFGQSIHHSQDGSFAGVEILARWDHPSYGLLAPADFLHVIREGGLEAVLDSTLFSTALAEMEQIETSGFRFPRVSFNVSPGRLLDATMQETMDVERAYWDGRIAFEMQEPMARADVPATLHRLAKLKAMGVQIDLDNFGSGRTSINSMIEISPDRLKIDRALVAELGTGGRADPIVTAIVEMAKAMKTKIVAEGIETEAQARTALERGMDLLQGYHFSKPQPLSDLVAHVTSQDRPWAPAIQEDDDAA